MTLRGWPSTLYADRVAAGRREHGADPRRCELVSMPSTRAGSLRERSRRASSSALASLNALYAGRVSAGQAVHDGELPVLDGLSQCPLRGPGLCGYWLAHCGDQLRLQCLNALYAGRVSAGVSRLARKARPCSPVSLPSTRAGSLRAISIHAGGDILFGGLNALYAGRVSAGLREAGLDQDRWGAVSMPSTRAGSLREPPPGPP